MPAPGSRCSTIAATEPGEEARREHLSLVEGVSQDASRTPSSLPDRYEDFGPIAAGASGEVRRVRDRTLNRLLAMKLLRFEHLHVPRMRARFLAESEVTAGLQHPGIVSVHDRGELPDGRLWFTMQEVRGRTLGAVIEELHAHKTPAGFQPTPSGWTFRRAIDAFARIAQAVGFAHHRGVVHRDLKPENLMVGELGEALVMDWGLARQSGVAETEGGVSGAGAPATSPDDVAFSPEDARRTREGDILGTPAYMPPEQALGKRALHGPRSDVYSLGAILYHMLTGRHPYSGRGVFPWREVLAGSPPSIAEVARGGPALPEELVSICERAMGRDIATRYADASTMAAELVDFLDGARRREQALAIVERVRSLEPTIAELRARKADLEAEARRLLEGIKLFEPVERKAPAWQLEDEAAKLGGRAALKETEWLEGVHGALSVEPGLSEAHAVLAEHYRARLLDAERASQGEDSIRFEALLRAHDRGHYASLLRGEGALTLLTDPPGANVALYRYREETRRLSPRFVEEIGPTPLYERKVLKGSYLCVLRAPGRAEVRYPVLIERGEHWDGVAPGEVEATPIVLPPDGEIGKEEVYIPAGFCWVGGDVSALDSLPRRRVWIDAFTIGQHPITNGEYLDFLNDLVKNGGEETAMRVCPRDPTSMSGAAAERALRLVYPRDSNGCFVLPEDPGFQADCPVAQLDWHGAVAFAAWRAARSGKPFRLPSELEREKAARGADGRFFPWGNFGDPTFACVAESHGDVPSRAGVLAFPADESPYGVRGLAGNMRDYCIEVWRREGPTLRANRPLIEPAAEDDPDFRCVRGGCWSSPLERARAAARFGNRPGDRRETIGMRLARSL